MFNESVYGQAELFTMLLAVLLGDTRQSLGIKLIGCLSQIGNAQKRLGQRREAYMHFLPLFLSYIFLRLNFK